MNESTNQLTKENDLELAKSDNAIEDEEEVIFLEEIPRAPVSSVPPESSTFSPSPPLQLPAYHPDCICFKCSLIKKLIAKYEQKDCDCVECRPISDVVAVPESRNQYQQQPSTSKSNSSNSDPKIPGNDPPRCPTPDYVPSFYPEDEEDDDDDNDEDDDGNHGNDENDENKGKDDDEKETNDLTSLQRLNLNHQSENDSDSTGYASSNSESSEQTKPTKPQQKTSTFHPFKCPRCNKRFVYQRSLLRHYHIVHMNLKAYYCRWKKCNFVSGRSDCVAVHIRTMHLKPWNVQKRNAYLYVGKRQMAKYSTTPKDPFLLKIMSQTERTKLELVCRHCSRQFFQSAQYKRHISSHEKRGYRCVYPPECDKFYTDLTRAKKHIWIEHLGKDEFEPIPSSKTNKFLVKVDQSLSRTKNAAKYAEKPRISSRNMNRTSDDEDNDEGDDNEVDDNEENDNEENDNEENDNEENDNEENDNEVDDNEVDDETESSESSETNDTTSDEEDEQNSDSEVTQSGETSKRIHPSPLTCPFTSCAAVFKKKAELTWHYKSHEGTESLYCWCGRGFTTVYNYHIHLMSHKRDGYRCTFKACRFFATQGRIVNTHIAEDHLGEEVDSVTPKRLLKYRKVVKVGRGKRN